MAGCVLPLFKFIELYERRLVLAVVCHADYCNSGIISSRNIYRFPKMSIITRKNVSLCGRSRLKNGVEIPLQREYLASIESQTCLWSSERDDNSKKLSGWDNSHGNLAVFIITHFLQIAKYFSAEFSTFMVILVASDWQLCVSLKISP